MPSKFSSRPEACCELRGAFATRKQAVTSTGKREVSSFCHRSIFLVSLESLNSDLPFPARDSARPPPSQRFKAIVCVSGRTQTDKERHREEYFLFPSVIPHHLLSSNFGWQHLSFAQHYCHLFIWFISTTIDDHWLRLLAILGWKETQAEITGDISRWVSRQMLIALGFHACHAMIHGRRTTTMIYVDYGTRSVSIRRFLQTSVRKLSMFVETRNVDSCCRYWLILLQGLLTVVLSLTPTSISRTRLVYSEIGDFI